MAGTWINDDYNSDTKSAKYIIEPDGTFTAYPQVNSNYITYGTFMFGESKIDQDGTIWMKQIKWKLPCME